MEESILLSIKKMLGIDANMCCFDPDIIICINSALSDAHQIGVGESSYLITDESSMWSDFIGDRTDLENLKMYTYLKTRLLFDPPSSGTIVNLFNEKIKELEFRLNVTTDV